MLASLVKSYQTYKKYYLQDYWNRPATQVSLELLLTLITIFLLIILALKPTFKTIISLSQEIKTKREVNQKLEKKIDDLTRAQINYAKAVQFLPIIDKILPQDADFARLEREIEYLAWINNLILADGVFDQFDLLGITSAKQASLQFKITLAGSYKDLKKFLQDLESLDRLINLEQVNISGKSKIEGAQLEAVISGKASYFFK